MPVRLNGLTPNMIKAVREKMSDLIGQEGGITIDGSDIIFHMERPDDAIANAILLKGSEFHLTMVRKRILKAIAESGV